MCYRLLGVGVWEYMAHVLVNFFLLVVVLVVGFICPFFKFSIAEWRRAVVWFTLKLR